MALGRPDTLDSGLKDFQPLRQVVNGQLELFQKIVVPAESVHLKWPGFRRNHQQVEWDHHVVPCGRVLAVKVVMVRLVVWVVWVEWVQVVVAMVRGTAVNRAVSRVGTRRVVGKMRSIRIVVVVALIWRWTGVIQH